MKVHYDSDRKVPPNESDRWKRSKMTFMLVVLAEDHLISALCNYYYEKYTPTICENSFHGVE
eukprot:9522257-Ditylum_brightwellii.AAC.1